MTCGRTEEKRTLLPTEQNYHTCLILLYISIYICISPCFPIKQELLCAYAYLAQCTHSLCGILRESCFSIYHSIPALVIFLLFLLLPTLYLYNFGPLLIQLSQSMSQSRASYRRLSSSASAAHIAMSSSAASMAPSLSREALAELANVIYNEVPRISSLTVGRYTYLNVFRGNTLCAFLKRYFRDRRRISLNERQVVSIARALLNTGIFTVISSGNNNNKVFSNDPACICHLRQVRSASKIHSNSLPSSPTSGHSTSHSNVRRASSSRK